MRSWSFLLGLALIALTAACGDGKEPSPAQSTPIREEPQSGLATSTPAPAETKAPLPFRYFTFYGANHHLEWDRGLIGDWAAANLDHEPYHETHGFYSAVIPSSQIVRVMETDPPFDVVSATVGGVFREYARDGLIADISDLWDQNGWHDQYPASVIEMASVDGRQYFLPLAQQWNPVWYRVDIFAANGLTPPTTWQELLDVCEALSDAGFIPITVSVDGWFAPTSRWFTMINVRLNGLGFHRQLVAGQVSWLDQRIGAVFDSWREMIDHRCFADDVATTTYAEAADQLADGVAAMYLLGEWLSESYSAGFPENLDFFSVPPIDPEQPRVELVHVFGAFIPAGATHPELARQFLTHLGSLEMQTAAWDSLGRVSTNIAVDQSIYGDLYARGVEFASNADAIVPLFEVSMRSNLVTRLAYSAFSNFLRNPDGLQGDLERLERNRIEQYGEALQVWPQG